jgi:hypothetical protein
MNLSILIVESQPKFSLNLPSIFEYVVGIQVLVVVVPAYHK